MKKLLVLLTMVLAAITSLYSAEYQYVPMVQEGTRWIHAYWEPALADETNPYPIIYYAVEMRGDTLIGGENYKKAYRYFLRDHKGLDTSTMYPCAYVREVGKKVYSINNDNVSPIGQNEKNTFGITVGSVDGHTEYQIYDFNNPGPFLKDYYQDIQYVGEDIVEIDGSLRKRHIFDTGHLTNNIIYLIEGIGYDQLERGDCISPFMEYFSCVCSNPLGLAHVENAEGEVIYKGKYYDPNVGVDDVLLDFFPADGRYYNLMGQPVAHPEAAPGIYIRDGKKVLVR